MTTNRSVATAPFGAGFELRAVSRRSTTVAPTTVFGVYKFGSLDGREWTLPTSSVKNFSKAVSDVIRALRPIDQSPEADR